VEKEGRVDAASLLPGAVSDGSCTTSGGVKGVISSGVSAGVDLSAAVDAMVLKRVPQLVHTSAPCGFIVPQIGQRTSVEGASSAAQFLQNLLLGLFGVPHCGQ
jgi:hypothetical protein